MAESTVSTASTASAAQGAAALAAQESALSLADITCTFTAREARSQRYTAVRDTTLAVQSGEFVSVVGPTGCGKSTLLNIAAGLLGPTSGQVHVFGEPLTGINRRAGYMFQGEALLPWRSAVANVMAGLEFAGASKTDAEPLARDWLKRVGLGGFEDRYPHQMSGGMRKRAMLAQTLIRDPDIILMDEPFSALDIQTRQLMENEVLELWMAKRKAVLFITHDLDEAIAMSDRRTPSANSPSTCRARATWPKCACSRVLSNCTRPSGRCCATKCSRATRSKNKRKDWL